MRPYILLLLVLLLNVGAYAQRKEVRIIAGKNELIKHGNALFPVVEPHIAVNPNNNNHMVAAGIVFDSAQVSSDRTHIAVFATKDNGKTWKQTDLPMKVGFDPWVAIKNETQVALVAMAGYGSGHRNALVYYFSNDGGFTWLANDTISFGGGHDHPTMVTDPRNGNLLILSSLIRRDTSGQRHSYAWLNYSSDWKTFQKKASLLHIGPVNSNTLTVNVNHQGTIILPYVEYSVSDNRAGNPAFKYSYFAEGRQFSTPHLITNNGGLAKGFAVSAIDVKGRFKGRMYFVKNTGTDPLRSDGLYLHYTDSLGGNWSEDIRIDHSTTEQKFIRTAAIAVNKDGVVGITWVDRRNDTQLKKNDIYFTVSLDGGKTFEKEVRITDVNSEPTTPLNGKAGERFVSGGDYMGCVAKPDGGFQVLWADNRSGIFQLYTSNIKIDQKD